jgi:hypothetical protein
MIRPAALFFLPNTTTLLARTAINLLRGASQEQLDEAIQTLTNRSLPAPAVMSHLEQNVHVGEVLEKLAADWSAETVRVFASALQMETSKTAIMDLIVAIAILNEPDLEAELHGENITDATAGDLVENRRITWQYPPPGTPLTPPYVVLVAVEQVDTSVADSEVQAILGELVDYRGYKIARRAPGTVRPGIHGIRLRPELLDALRGRGLEPVLPPAPPSQPPAPTEPAPPVVTVPGIPGVFPGVTIPGVNIPGVGAGTPGVGIPGLPGGSLPGLPGISLPGLGISMPGSSPVHAASPVSQPTPPPGVAATTEVRSAVGNIGNVLAGASRLRVR